MFSTSRPVMTVTPNCSSRLQAYCESGSGKRGEDFRFGLDQQHAGQSGVDPAEVAGAGMAGKLGDCIGHFRSGGPAAHDDRGHQGLALVRIGNLSACSNAMAVAEVEQGGSALIHRASLRWNHAACKAMKPWPKPLSAGRLGIVTASSGVVMSKTRISPVAQLPVRNRPLDETGIQIYDQWSGQPVHEQGIQLDGGWGAGNVSKSNDGKLFRVVLVGPVIEVADNEPK
jgi:hypothetical protein